MKHIAQSQEKAAMLRERGMLAARLNDHASAAGLLRESLALDPGHAETHSALGDSLMYLDDFAGAEPHCRRACELDPQTARFAFNLGRTLEGIGDRSGAIVQYRLADSLAPHHTGTLIRLARLLRETARAEEAIACIEPVVMREPENVAALFELASAHDRLNHFDDAACLFARAVALAPGEASIVNNLAFSLASLARHDEAETHFRRALQLDPALREAEFQLSFLRLRRGDYAQGWPLFESRKLTHENKPNYRKLPTVEWQGEPLAGKRVLIAREQGAGDEIQFLRYASLLAARGAQVDAWVAPELGTLAATVPGIARALDAIPDDVTIARDYHFWCDVASLPLKFADAPIPADTPYMRASAADAAAWHARIEALAPHARRRVGIVWAGNPRHRYDSLRSMPLDTLLPLASVKDHAWFAIQKGPAAAQLADVTHAWPIHAIGDDLHDFASTAALIERLDLIITVDTSVAHLAGALGKPVWVLLAAYSDWRWGTSGRECVWYPSARLFRQRRLSDWNGVVAELVAELETHAP